MHPLDDDLDQTEVPTITPTIDKYEPQTPGNKIVTIRLEQGLGSIEGTSTSRSSYMDENDVHEDDDLSYYQAKSPVEDLGIRTTKGTDDYNHQSLETTEPSAASSVHYQ